MRHDKYGRPHVDYHDQSRRGDPGGARRRDPGDPRHRAPRQLREIGLHRRTVLPNSSCATPMRRLALLIVAMLLIAAAPARVPVRDNTVAGAITSFPASGRAYDIWNNAYNQALQQYSDDRAAYQEQEAVSTITGTKYYRGLNLRPALDSDLQPFNFLSASGVFQFGMVGDVSANTYEWADGTGPYLTFDTANRRATFGVPPGLPSYTIAALPACTNNQLANVTNGIRGLWICRGTTWQSVTGYADVRDFGAVGDGTTDDSAAIQATITAAAAGANKRVYCPAGTYLVANLSG